MLASMETYLLRGQRQLRRWLEDARVRRTLKVLLYGGAGFFLSAAALRETCQPLAMGLVCAVTGWRAVTVCLGSMMGYSCFWGSGGMQGMVWAALGAAASLFLGKGEASREQPLLIPILSGFLVSATGLTFQLLGLEDPPLSIYLLRIAAAAGSTLLFTRAMTHRDAITVWVAGGIGVLALAPVNPLGYIAGGAVALSGAFPAAALAGLGLDLAQVTPVPMAAVLCTAYFSRLLSPRYKWVRQVAPAAACLAVMALCGIRDFTPLPGLLLGGCLGMALPAKPELQHRRGETGIVQVRLEMTAGILARIQQLLLEIPPSPIDEAALLSKAKQRSCATCSARNVCLEQEKLNVQILHYPLSFQCRKTGRIAAELRRSQEQLRSMKADRERQQQYRAAVIQQYRFLSEFLRCLSDQLPRRGDRITAHFRIEVSARSVSAEESNGDRCMAFSGPGCKYYVLLCDGMGTGLGAAHEGNSTAELLRQMLCAGFPPEHAFRSVNSILALRGQAGAATLDLAEIRLDSGRITLYKWGAAPSWILKKKGAEKIGTATPPPGISVTEGRETVTRLSLGRGEVLILLSDGVEVGEILRRKGMTPDAPPGELAERLLELGCRNTSDDATAAVIKLHPVNLSA